MLEYQAERAKERSHPDLDPANARLSLTEPCRYIASAFESTSAALPYRML